MGPYTKKQCFNTTKVMTLNDLIPLMGILPIDLMEIFPIDVMEIIPITVMERNGFGLNVLISPK